MQKNKVSLLFKKEDAVRASKMSSFCKKSVKKGLKNYPLKLNTSKLLLKRTVLVCGRKPKKKMDLILINDGTK